MSYARTRPPVPLLRRHVGGGHDAGWPGRITVVYAIAKKPHAPVSYPSSTPQYLSTHPYLQTLPLHPPQDSHRRRRRPPPPPLHGDRNAVGWATACRRTHIPLAEDLCWPARSAHARGRGHHLLLCLLLPASHGLSGLWTSDPAAGTRRMSTPTAGSAASSRRFRRAAIRMRSAPRQTRV